jgi:hypothetical protein
MVCLFAWLTASRHRTSPHEWTAGTAHTFTAWVLFVGRWRDFMARRVSVEMGRQDMLGGGSGEGKGGAAAEKVEAAPLWFPDREISIMDKRMLFAVLELYGAPTSGKVRER